MFLLVKSKNDEQKGEKSTLSATKGSYASKSSGGLMPGRFTTGSANSTRKIF